MVKLTERERVFVNKMLSTTNEVFEGMLEHMSDELTEKLYDMFVKFNAEIEHSENTIHVMNKVEFSEKHPRYSQAKYDLYLFLVTIPIADRDKYKRAFRGME